MSSILYKRLCFGTVLSIGAYYAYLAPNTILLKKTTGCVTLYRNVTEVKVKKQLRNKVQAVMDELKLPDNIKQLIKPFHIIGYDIFEFGTLKSKFGALIGLPRTFYYKSVEDIDKFSIMMNDEYADWDDDDVVKLWDALVLSEDAKTFAIARSILRLQDNEHHINAYTLAGTIVAFFALSGILDSFVFKTDATKSIKASKELNKLDFKSSKSLNDEPRKIKPLIQPIYRRPILAALFFTGIGTWLLMKDRRCRNFDRENDKALAELGPTYIKAGKEFYEKYIIRNIALRKIGDTMGEYLYLPNGDFNFGLRQKCLPLTERKNFFETKLQSLNELK